MRMSRFHAVNRIRNRVGFVEDRDPADRQQNDAFRRNARSARHQRVTNSCSTTLPKMIPTRANPRIGRTGILSRTGFVLHREDEQKQKGQVDADFDSEKSPTGMDQLRIEHAYQYSIYLDTD